MVAGEAGSNMRPGHGFRWAVLMGRTPGLVCFDECRPGLVCFLPGLFGSFCGFDGCHGFGRCFVVKSSEVLEKHLL